MAAINAQTLISEAKCYECYGASMADMLRIALLIQQLQAADPAADVTPQGLLEYGKCYACLGISQSDIIQLALLSQLAGAASPCVQLIETTPANQGQQLGVFTYFGDGITFTELTWNAENAIVGLDIEGVTQLERISAPYLISVDPSDLQSGSIFLTGLTSLVSVDFPLLQALNYTGGFVMRNCSALTSINFPSLTTAKGLICEINSSLTTILLPNLIFENGGSYTFRTNALNASTVNALLARAVLTAPTSCTIQLQGGTNSAPTGQGILDKAALILAGNTVTTN